MNPEDIGRILDEVGERIGPAGEYAWRVAVQHTAISAWINVIGPLVVALIALPMAIYFGRRTDFNADSPGFNGTMLIVSGALAFTGILVFSMVAGTAIPDALVPEWGAIRKVLESR